MANIKKLQLNGEDIIPITHELAVIDDNGISIVDKYQTKEDQNLDTNSKTIIGAINELNVNNVHLGNALGAVEYDDNDNPIIERLDDLESSLIKLIGNSSNNESAKDEALKNLLAGILREEGIEIAEGDTLTDLITKVDNGFDSKNAELEELENSMYGSYIKQVYCGYRSTFALRRDGVLLATGYNQNGNLGSGDTTSRTKFEQVADNVKDVTCGTAQTFITKKDGKILCCGSNSMGSLGFGDSNEQHTAFDIELPINNVKEIITKDYSTFIIKTDGTLWATGYNSYGELGLSHADTCYTFTQVPNITNVKKVYGCGNTTFVMTEDNCLYATGLNTNGQLGLGDTNNRNVFTLVMENADDILDLEGSGQHTLILKSDGNIWGTGSNLYAALGTGDRNNCNVFTQITTSGDFKEIEVGYSSDFSIAIKNDGTIWHAGDTDYGCVGKEEGSSYFTSFTVNDTVGGTDIVAIDVGQYHTAIVRSDGSLWVTGYNNAGQLGLGDTTHRYAFTKAIGASNSGDGGLDIISAAELPASGNENQICVITDNPTDKFILSYAGFSDFIDVDNSTICGDMSLAPSYASVLINTGSVSQRYNFLKFIQDSNLKLSYIYQNNNWNEFTIERSYLINNKVHVTDSEFGGFYNLSSVSSYAAFNDNGLDFNVTAQYGKVRLCTVNKVDFSLFNHMVITRSSNTSYHVTYIYRTDTQDTSAAYYLYKAISPYITIDKETQYQSGVGYTFETTVYDISDWDGVYYLSVDLYSKSGGSVDTMISDLYFY